MTDSPLLLYRKRCGLSRASLAAALGCNESTITRVENGTSAPSYNLASVIEDFSSGAVTVASLYGWLKRHRGTNLPDPTPFERNSEEHRCR